jgi:hypothetical protein
MSQVDAGKSLIQSLLSPPSSLQVAKAQISGRKRTLREYRASQGPRSKPLNGLGNKALSELTNFQPMNPSGKKMCRVAIVA